MQNQFDTMHGGGGGGGGELQTFLFFPLSLKCTKINLIRKDGKIKAR